MYTKSLFSHWHHRIPGQFAGYLRKQTLWHKELFLTLGSLHYQKLWYLICSLKVQTALSSVQRTSLAQLKLGLPSSFAVLMAYNKPLIAASLLLIFLLISPLILQSISLPYFLLLMETFKMASCSLHLKCQDP